MLSVSPDVDREGTTLAAGERVVSEWSVRSRQLREPGRPSINKQSELFVLGSHLVEVVAETLLIV
jgi:hypothetical protein